MGIRLLNDGQLKQAEPCLMIASGANSALATEAKPDQYFVLILACINSGALQKALKHQRVASAVYPDDIRFTSLKGWILCAQGKREEALRWCLENDSEPAGPYLLRQASEY